MPTEVLVTLAAILRDLSLGMAVGGLLIMGVVVPRSNKAAFARSRLLAQIGANLAVVATVGYSLARYASIDVTNPGGNRFFEAWWMFTTEIDLGRAYGQMIIGALVLSVIVGLVNKPAAALWGLAPAVWIFGWQALTGHSATSTNHHLAVSGMAVHLASSAVWLGLLLVIAFMRRPLGDDAKLAIRRMSRIAIWMAALLVVSGIANATLRVNADQLFTTTYGRLLVLKIVLMALAVALAAWHRRVMLPRLSEAEVAAKFWRVFMVDVLALVSVVAVAGVLSGTAPPAGTGEIGRPSPAEQLTGYPLPPVPTTEVWFTVWRLEIITAIAIAAGAWVYLRWAIRLAKRGDRWPVMRTLSWFVGLAIMVYVTQGALAVYGAVMFSSHMTLHMIMAMVAPMFLALGAPVTLAMRALPVRDDGSMGPREFVAGIVNSRWLRFLSHPIVAAVNFAGSMIFFYLTDAFVFALSNHVGHLLMVAHFTAAGYFFVNSLVGIDPGPSRSPYPLRLVILFATMAFHAFFGVMIMSSTVLYAPDWYGLMGRTWGPDALGDQEVGGQIAWGIGELPVLVLAIGVMVLWRKKDAKDAKRQDRQAKRDDDAALRAYNEMLGNIARGDGQ